MQTHFSLAQLEDPDLATANDILRKCVHCGFCTATCPTYVTLGDELDSPRGRIYQIKDMLEGDKDPAPSLVTHIDRCLSCLSCMTTCPSGVHYMHLVDIARERIHDRFKRPVFDRALRKVLAWVLPNPQLFRLSLVGAWIGKPVLKHLPGRLGAMFRMAPSRIEKPSLWDVPQTIPAEGPRKGRVALMSGCAQQVLQPRINEATIRLLTRMGYDVVVAAGAGCCGALTHHMGDTKSSHGQAARNIRAWTREIDGDGLDAVIINASGCGTTVKDYGFMFRTDGDLAEPAKAISALTKDITEFVAEKGLPAVTVQDGSTVAYHSACSMQHGQKITDLPKTLLSQAGFAVKSPAEGHLCCGSAGTYNLLQPELADTLKARKLANIEKTGAAIVAAGNIGCLEQIASGTDMAVVHTVELLDWVTGGPVPKALDGRA
ncbi:glycolate oxidase subunit GlcF [Rhodospirillaceae bacterium KN72]|uniref:Glycolate oxidase iron-sulfur subunit n=1 Tax=Pacificispira spongiicola TaxID=2729598 RepID=A0A7Y0E230_9PROT|nr:glycolate oxidase subunit GlcF [Pacificispira spongiicola]NMM45822.1 glycolate oxidase subunit GlcF [Pacificispira spongiicola]